MTKPVLDLCQLAWPPYLVCLLSTCVPEEMVIAQVRNEDNAIIVFVLSVKIHLELQLWVWPESIAMV